MSWLRLVRFFELPVISPPRVKALIWRVPVEEITLVPPPLKVKAEPEPVMVWEVDLKPLEISRLPAKEEEPVPVSMMLPVLMTRLVPTIEAAVRPLVISRLPEKELEPVPVDRN